MIQREVEMLLSERYGLTTRISSISHLHGGRMNLSYRVDLADGMSLVVQKLLGANERTPSDMKWYAFVYERVSSTDATVELPRVILDLNGQPVTVFGTDRYHVQAYIPNDPLASLNAASAYSAGKLLAELRNSLDGVDVSDFSSWTENWATNSFDDSYLRKNWEKFTGALSDHEDHPCFSEVKVWYDELAGWVDLWRSLDVPAKKGIIHTDAKFANILFRNGEAFAFVDPDFAYSDTIAELGQMLRSFVGKGERGLVCDVEIFRSTVRGYNTTISQGSQVSLDDAWGGLLYQSIALPIRFAADVLNGDDFPFDTSRGFVSHAEQSRADFFKYRTLAREVVTQRGSFCN